MSAFAALMLLAAVSGPTAPVPANADGAPCAYPTGNVADDRSQVLAVVSRFALAVSCGDLAMAQTLVAADGTVSELEDDQDEHGQPVQGIATASWQEQLALFTGAAGPRDAAAREMVRLGEATVLIDGGSALVRQPVQSHAPGDAAAPTCFIQHIMLANDGRGWKIRHMMLVSQDQTCTAVAPLP